MTAALSPLPDRAPRQPLDGILVLAEQIGHLLVQLADLLVDQSQFLQRHLQQPPVDRLSSAHAPSASHNCAGVARKR